MMVCCHARCCLGFGLPKHEFWCRKRCCWMASHLAKLLSLRCGLVFSLFLFVFPVKALFGSCFCDAANDLVIVGNNSGQVHTAQLSEGWRTSLCSTAWVNFLCLWP